MHEKDVSLKALIKQTDVFCDIINNLVFGGRKATEESYLVPADISSASQYPSDWSIHEQIRDVAMFDKRNNIVYCMYGIENESAQKEYEILRMLGYDGAAYQEQVAKKRKDKDFRYYPVITIVLNYSRYKWSKPRSLHQLLGIEKNSPLASLVNDYKLRVINVGYLSPEDRTILRSDFRAICAALNQLYTGIQIPAQEFSGVNYEHPLEVMNVLNAFSETDGLWDNLNRTEGGVTMTTDLATRVRQEERESIIEQLMKFYGWTKEQTQAFLQGKGHPQADGSIKKLNLG